MSNHTEAPSIQVPTGWFSAHRHSLAALFLLVLGVPLVSAAFPPGIPAVGALALAVQFSGGRRAASTFGTLVWGAALIVVLVGVAIDVFLLATGHAQPNVVPVG